MGAASIILVYSSQAIYNNIMDVEADRINAPERPLARGTITANWAWAAYFLALLSGFLVAFYAGILPGIIVLAMLGFVYSRYTKRMGVYSYATLTCSHICIPMLIGYSLFAGVDSTILLIVAFVFVTKFLAISLKDYKDVEGDSRNGMRTLPVEYGVGPASKITAAGLLSTLPLFWIPWHILHLSVFFLAAYFLSGLMRAVFARKITSGVTPAGAADILKKFRFVLIAEMLAWCIA